MRATAEASPNIALVKYWGKRDVERNLPSTGSLSITLDSLKTRMTVELDDVLPADTLLVNDIPAAGMLPRVSACLDQLLGADRATARLSSYGNFPIAAGLASSAAAFAALVVAASAAAGQRRDRLDLARVAGAASGSAARSLYGGFVELKNTIDDIAVASFVDPGDWPLQVIVAINAAGEKSVSSGEAMRRSAATSPFYQSWVRQQDRQVLAARRADRSDPAERSPGASWEPR